MANIVIDSSVLADMLFSHRPRHSQAKRIYDFIKEENFEVLFPMHAHFEIISAARMEKNQVGQPLELMESFDADSSINLKPIPIDTEFVNSYFPQQLIELKAGDMIFVGIALKEKCPLITEDNQMYREAQKLQIDVNKVGEFIEKYID
ncbi:type II toxin-antitoxin system VapC family toxin [Fulvivirga lutea]|uniref:Type II toxin-antitoxin system VapC family toxin n=1 Tax=Fulvivirga lutea TaxID=2810512 RepID=A0A974WHA8_9BACT|nr:type II toxin-antitoxin system VapC family toxin [Fulvivirga lutea]QSE97222.1 type II toxin-antitoxin system VapC family toxin [Fulvivirga lutea]